jgi:hypothetical protein
MPVVVEQKQMERGGHPKGCEMSECLYTIGRATTRRERQDLIIGGGVGPGIGTASSGLEQEAEADMRQCQGKKASREPTDSTPQSDGHARRGRAAGNEVGALRTTRGRRRDRANRPYC